jgi:hypothetical protein
MIIDIISKPTMSPTELLKLKLYRFMHIRKKDPQNSMHTAKIDKSTNIYSIVQKILKLAGLRTRLLQAKCNSFTCVH